MSNTAGASGSGAGCSADESFTLSLDGFEVLPDTPASMRGVRLEDFTEASPLKQTYCTVLSETAYAQQSCSETEKAIMELISHLEKNPAVYMDLLRKRKKEEMEGRSFVSYLKSKLMLKLKGEKFVEGMVSDKECEEKLCEVKTGMLMAFNYNKENMSQRFSRRLLEKRRARLAHDGTPVKAAMSSAPCSVPPPPPPPPPPGPPPTVYTPLKDVKNVKPMQSCQPMTPVEALVRRPIRKPVARTDSLMSVHEQLVSTNPLKRLKSTRNPRSPGGTPMKKRARRLSAESLYTPDALKDKGEPLTTAFMRIMEQKFRNVRSPSPATTAFRSPVQNGFTP